MRPLRFIAILILAFTPLLSACREGGITPDAAAAETEEPAVALPNKEGSLKFAVLGDFGTGSREQYELAAQMNALHDRFKYSMVALVGDNLYGSERPQDFKKKFEEPYKKLLTAGVKFYASLGKS